jgi:hypothetical protein
LTTNYSAVAAVVDVEDDDDDVGLNLDAEGNK